MENVEQRRSANNNNKTEMKKYLPTKTAGGGALCGSRGLTCVVCPAVGQTEGVGVAPCLLVFLEPAKIGVQKSGNIHQQAQVPSQIRDVTLSRGLMN